MIRSFADRETERLFAIGRSKRLGAELIARGKRKLQMLDTAVTLEDLTSPPGNRLALRGKRRGQYSIRINDQFRICFRWRDGDAFNVEITDYH